MCVDTYGIFFGFRLTLAKNKIQRGLCLGVNYLLDVLIEPQ